MTIVRPACVPVLAFLLLSQPAQPEKGNRIPTRTAAIATLTPAAWQQDGESEEAVDPVRARKLSGYVHMAVQKETALAQVLVEECDASWNRVLASTKTDYQGHFELKPAKRGRVHYLRLSAKGFSTHLYQVTLSPDAPPELMLELRLASKSQDGPPRWPSRTYFAGRALTTAGIS